MALIMNGERLSNAYWSIIPILNDELIRIFMYELLFIIYYYSLRVREWHEVNM